MKSPLKYLSMLVLMLCGVAVLSSFLAVRSAAVNKTKFTFPYKQYGLTERQAAAHLLSRFTYGPTPGEIDAVVKMGLENWFQQQLDGNMPDDSLNTLLDQYPDLKLTNAQIADIYPRGGAALRMAIRDGVIDKDSAKADRKEYRDALAAYMQKKGLKPAQELFRQFYNQKILRAAYSNNQLREVLTDFWFNHFNVSTTKNDCAEFIPDYERDVIRPNVTGKFGDLLLATAKSPAMLYYLDNFSSSGTNANQDRNPQFQRRLEMMQKQMADNPQMAAAVEKLQKGRKNQGLNENYAREVMELHTLGVDGGYTQQDVTQAAKVLTGWTVYPMGQYMGGGAGGGMMQQLVKMGGEERMKERGFIHDGDFLFTPNRHDTGSKTVLGRKFGNEGYQEGVDLLDMLAHHNSTSKFITKKIAVRFVNDTPPQTLLDKMAKTFKDKDGDIREVMITMATAPEFWNPSAVREKTKSPFELVVSSVRSLDAKIYQPFQLYSWANKMGQKMYAYQAPTGFPDRGQYWINTGALLNRMNFGLALASGRIPGVRIDLAALNNHHEPESPEAALRIYSKLVMPERNIDATIKQLTPMLSDPNLVQKVSDAADKAAPKQPDMSSGGNMQDMMMANAGDPQGKGGKKNFGKKNGYQAQMTAQGNNSMLSQVVGIIVGSPEFQRR
ncbi:DUF1800 domain-containing protein [Mucilaginibacter mali]|uniref:DUF1800 domain-containing protein n=1 Tax=Mucilaginibacter mali TaxID=2740462 RepID=A0A7D4UD11_9SPHI|nr:DUF1800 domain-containing protein [Mucilaginibacter mali]QKJ30039.1 DUF1800 domain-containing protein [Mucilaginibacter mali]